MMIGPNKNNKNLKTKSFSFFQEHGDRMLGRDDEPQIQIRTCAQI